MGALTDACTLILEKVIEGYDEADITDAPDRQYVSPGSPPADCELVAVWGVPQAKDRGGANADPSSQNCNLIPEASISITSWLCVPTGTPPKEADLTAAATRLHDHLWAVWSHLAHLISTGALRDDLQCKNARLLNATAIEDEEGAFVGWTIPLYLDLNPFRTDPAS